MSLGLIWRIFDWNSNKTNSFWSTLIFSWYFATKLHTWLTHMIQCDFNQQFFTKASFKSKNKWSNWPEICYEKHFFHCFLFFMWMWKWEIKVKVLNILVREERLFMSIDIQKVPMLRHPVQTNWFNNFN